MKIPLVLIVGRPNVGKSTLYNRLTKDKDAIVDDFSGVTRDRLYGTGDWNGRQFKVIDTGGYVPDSDDLFEKAIVEQIQIGLDEADAILFVTDSRVGVTPVDYEIAGLLRKSKKPVYVLVNKADNMKIGEEATDFYSLGMPNIYDISALNGRNTGDVLDDLIEDLNFDDLPEEEDERLKISILGRPNAGKSSLTNALLGYDRSIVTDIPGTTRDSINSVMKYHGEEIVLIDTAGLRKKTRVKENIEFYSTVRTYKALAKCDVAIIMVDANIGLGKQDQTIISEAIRRRKGIIIAVNKWDLIEKDQMTYKEFEDEIKYKLGSTSYIPVMFVSALTKQRIYKLVEKAKSINEERHKIIPKKVLNDELLEEFKKTTPPTTSTGKEVKVKFITQVGDKYPIFLLFANEANDVPKHYRRFCENKIRELFGFEGVPITVSFKDK